MVMTLTTVLTTNMAETKPSSTPIWHTYQETISISTRIL